MKCELKSYGEGCLVVCSVFLFVPETYRIQDLNVETLCSYCRVVCQFRVFFHLVNNNIFA
jgi:hypothetical protein